jgi:hypothetical protein
VTLRHSGAELGAEERRLLEEEQRSDERYESRVSEGLVTRIREGHVLVAGGGSLLALWAVARFAAGRLERKAGG